MKGLHYKIVYKILPSFAERLKREGVIFAYDRKQFRIRLVKDSPLVRIIPDLVVYLPDKRKVLVEVANPKKPKRFVGELVYPHLLGHFKKIEAAIVFVLPYANGGKLQEIDRGMVQLTRSMVQEMALDRFFKRQIPSIVIHSDFSNTEETYRVLHLSLTDYQRLGKFH